MAIETLVCTASPAAQWAAVGFSQSGGTVAELAELIDAYAAQAVERERERIVEALEELNAERHAGIFSDVVIADAIALVKGDTP